MATTRSDRPKMTAEDARRFDRVSLMNAATVATALECGCIPYQDVFTFRRWIAQGFVVRKGEHGIKLPVLIEREIEDDGQQTRVQRLRRTSAVFCRCQVKPLEEKE